MKSAAAPDHDPDRNGMYLRDEDEVARVRGIGADDRVEVQPWLERERRWTFVTRDAPAIDLACVHYLTKTR